MDDGARLLTALVAGAVFGDVSRGDRFQRRHLVDSRGRKQRHGSDVDEKIYPGRGRTNKQCWGQLLLGLTRLSVR